MGQLLVLIPTSRISALGQEWRVVARPVKARRTHTGARCGLGPERYSFASHCTSGEGNRVLARWACLNADDCLRGRVETGLCALSTQRWIQGLKIGLTSRSVEYCTLHHAFMRHMTALSHRAGERSIYFCHSGGCLLKGKGQLTNHE